jgi:predicted Zn-dependent protease with MMP-like domain
MKARLLGRNMSNMPDADITDFLLEVAEKTPEKIINLYTGEDITLRILFMDGKDKHIIIYKNKVYTYADVVLGATDESVI